MINITHPKMTFFTLFWLFFVLFFLFSFVLFRFFFCVCAFLVGWGVHSLNFTIYYIAMIYRTFPPKRGVDPLVEFRNRVRASALNYK